MEEVKLSEEDINFCLDYCLDYTTYEAPKKNVIDIDEVLSIEKPKLNRNNRIFSENLDMFLFPDVPDIAEIKEPYISLTEDECKGLIKLADERLKFELSKLNRDD